MRKTMLVLACVSFFAGCRMKVEPGINAGIDECENCSMVIQNIDQGAVTIDSAEEIHTFCNPVCLIYETNKIKESEKSPDWRIYLFDHDNNNAIPSDKANIVHGNFRTAMGFGLLAFESSARAAAFSKDAGREVISWNDLRLEYESPDVRIDLGSGVTGGPDKYEADRGDMVAVSYKNGSSQDNKIILTGYDFEISAKPHSDVSRSLIVDRPGEGFAFQISDGMIVGLLSVKGDHTSEEADYR